MEISERAVELARAGLDVINLCPGESDYDTPESIKDAAIKAITNGKTKYTAVDGVLPLKEAIINKLNIEHNLQYDLNQILVSCGAKQSLYNFMCTAIMPGDEVILLSPYWPTYLDLATLVGAIPIIIHCPIEQNFKLLPQQLENAITNKTRAIIINNPCNPTGAVYTKNELRGIANVLLRHENIFIISDQIYEHIVWQNFTAENILSSCKELFNRTVIISGVSKSYSMTGWRIGYAAGPEMVISKMKILQSQCTSNPSSISQFAAEAALKGDQAFTLDMVNKFKERYTHIYNLLSQHDFFQCIPSGGTFYLFPKLKGAYARSISLMGYKNEADFFLEEAQVAIVPGEVFGMKNHFRICFAKPDNILTEVVNRLCASLGCLKL